jgi:hypothetical protein
MFVGFSLIDKKPMKKIEITGANALMREDLEKKLDEEKHRT